MTSCSHLDLIFVKDFSSIFKQREKWNELLNSSDAKYPFSTIEWLEVWWKTYSNVTTSFCLIAYNKINQQWVGALPISIRKTTTLDLRTRIMSQMGGDLADYQAPIIRRGWELYVIALFFDKVKALTSDYDLLILNNIPQKNICSQNIENELSKRGWIYHKKYSLCPVLLIDNKKYTEIKKKYRKKHLSDIIRQCKRLSEKGNISLKIFRTKDEIEYNFELFLIMYEKRWRHAGMPNPLKKDLLISYYSNLVSGLHDSFLHFSALYLNNRPISYHIGFLYEGWFYYYKPTYDVEFEKFSPGKIHINMLIEKGCEDKWKAFDFLRGEERYKFDFTSDVIKTFSFIIAPRKVGLKYKWHTGGKKNVYKIFGKFYRKIKFYGQI